MREESATPFGHPHRHYRSTDSTNSRARELAAAGAPHGTVITAAEQTAGRGRQGRSWTAPPGKALLYSAIVRPLEERHLTLPLAVPLAVCEAAEQLNPDLECKVKWPNDVLVNGRKLAGVLIEARPQDGWAVIGVGLNLSISRDDFPPGLRETAVSIFTARGGDREGGSFGPSPLLSGGPPLPVPLTAAAALNDRLAHWTEAEPDEVLAAWRTRDALRGREVEWEGGSGVADGVDDRGYLVVIAPGGDRIAVGAGEVHLTRF
jgi:BirA family transcriptional regulator, biotin operon repressor / biotin---[acetyl-CoA-carboxylase] ligase